jgi:hypothetical protein
MAYQSTDSAAAARSSIPQYLHTDKLAEHFRQLDERASRSEDIWLGTTWCELDGDIFSATKRAIEVLIDLVRLADVPTSDPDAKQFRGLLAEFDKLAEPEVEDPVRSTRKLLRDKRIAADESNRVLDPSDPRTELEAYGEAMRSRTQPLVIRVGSPFTTPRVRKWCDPLTSCDEEFIPLARWNGFVEFVTHRNMPPEC